MSWTVLIIFVILAAAAMIIERSGKRLAFSPRFKGDLKRESRWFAQYGQAACALVVAAVVYRLDHRRFSYGWSGAVWVIGAVFWSGLAAIAVKKLAGRVRPGHERAGQFLGPHWGHANRLESFPSSHTTCAVAMSVVLSRLYPPAAPIFWTLAILCAALRYLLEAHWPSDILAGVALGCAIGGVGVWNMGA